MSTASRIWIWFGAVIAALAALCLIVAPANAATLAIRSIQTSAYPEIGMTLSVPASVGERPRFTVLENGDAAEVLSTKAIRNDVPIEVVLVMDTSGSMEGRPMTDAKSAAAQFVDRLPANASVAIVGFGSEPRVVSEFRTDRSALKRALYGLRADGETALYDAIVTATRLPSSSDAENVERTIVLVSDGGDTASRANLDQTARLVKRAGVPTLAVAVASPEYNARALKILADRSGGRLVTVKNTEALSAFFQSAAEELSGGWQIAFRSNRPITKNLELDVEAKGSAGTATAATVITNPRFVTAVPVAGRVFTVGETNPIFLTVAIVAAFACVTALALAAVLTLVGKGSYLERLRYYDQLQVDGAGGELAGGVPAKVIAAVDSVANRHGFSGVIGSKLEKAGIMLRPAEWISLHIVGVVLGGFLVQMTLGRVLLSAIAIVILAVGPLAVLDSLGRKRTERFDTQLPDVLTLLAGGLRTGWGLQQSIELVVAEAQKPACDEFRRAQIEVRLGVPLERALQNMADRLESEPFQWVVTAVAIQREVGGNLAEVLDNVAASLRDREAMNRQVAALSAEGRMSGVVLTILPFALIALMLVITPTYLVDAVRTPAGIAIALGGGLLLGIGILWLRAISRIEY